MSILKPHLDKMVAPFFIKTKDYQDKLAARQTILEELMKHIDDSTLPKSIVAMRMPQVPQLAEDDMKEFHAKWADIANRAAREGLRAIIDIRQKELTALQATLEETTTQAKNEVASGVTILVHELPDIDEAACSRIIARYSLDIDERMANQSKKAMLAAGYKKYQQVTKRAALAERQLEEEINPDDTDEITKLRKEMESLKKSVKQFKTAGAHQHKQGNGKGNIQPKGHKNGPNPKGHTRGPQKKGPQHNPKAPNPPNGPNRKPGAPKKAPQGGNKGNKGPNVPNNKDKGKGKGQRGAERGAKHN